MLKRRRLAVLTVVAAAAVLWLASVAEAKLALQFDRASARPGERVTVTFGDYFTSPNHAVEIYLVRASILGRVIRPELGGGTERLGPPPRLTGVVKVGQTGSAERGLTFRVPGIRSGRYAAVIWCPTCPYPYLLASLPGSIPEGAYVRPTRALLRVLDRERGAP